MSAETVRLVTSIFEAYTKGDLKPLEAALAENAEWLGAEPGTACHGRSEVIGFLTRHLQNGLRPQLEETIEVGDRALTVVRVPGIAALQGRERDERGYHVLSFRDGSISEVRDYTTREAALASMGS